MNKRIKKYNPVRYYKKFKSEYTYFVLFIRCKDYYYTYDVDAEIMMYIYDDFNDSLEYKILKEDFVKVLGVLHNKGLNVVLTGSKNSKEYYTELSNNYEKIKKKAKAKYKATIGSVSKKS